MSGFQNVGSRSFGYCSRIQLVLANPENVLLDWDLGNLGARSVPQAVCFVCQAVPEKFLQCGGVHCPARKMLCKSSAMVWCS